MRRALVGLVVKHPCQRRFSEGGGKPGLGRECRHSLYERGYWGKLPLAVGRCPAQLCMGRGCRIVVGRREVKLVSILLLCVLGCADPVNVFEGGTGYTADEYARHCAEPYGVTLPRSCAAEACSITSDLTAACRALSALPHGVEPMSGGEWRYTILERGETWDVLFHDPSRCVRGGAYLVKLDASSGQVLAVQPQR